MTRDDNCLPRRIKAVLASINEGDFEAVGQMIASSAECSHQDVCDVCIACQRIHKAFLPLVPKA